MGSREESIRFSQRRSVSSRLASRRRSASAANVREHVRDHLAQQSLVLSRREGVDPEIVKGDDLALVEPAEQRDDAHILAAVARALEHLFDRKQAGFGIEQQDFGILPLEHAGELFERLRTSRTHWHAAAFEDSDQSLRLLHRVFEEDESQRFVFLFVRHAEIRFPSVF